MDASEVKEIIACLPRGDTPFWYFRDRYALLLVSMLGDLVSKQDIKASPCAQLLDKAAVKAVLAQHGGRAVPKHEFELEVRDVPLTYSLTLDTWGSDKARWVQTTRRGYSLVLQLNFPTEHNRTYRRLIDPAGRMPLVYRGHPVRTGRKTTLAWARLDVDLDAGEVLIEEIQSDWMRHWKHQLARARKALGVVWIRGLQVHRLDVMRYCYGELAKHDHWPETMLAASLWFSHRELGIRRVFYHTHDSGAALKRTGDRKPPRSLYTKLPARFCFRETEQRPAFMRHRIRTNCTKRAIAQAKFQILEF